MFKNLLWSITRDIRVLVFPKRIEYIIPLSEFENVHNKLIEFEILNDELILRVQNNTIPKVENVKLV